MSWAVDLNNDEETLVLSWSETKGPPVCEPSRRAFGLRLVERSIAQELSGKADIAFEPTGIRCTLSFPITRASDGPASEDQPAVHNF